MKDCYTNDYNPKEIGNILKVIKDKGYAHAWDISQFSRIGIPINSYLIDYYNNRNEYKIDIEELFTIIRDKKVTYNDIINAFKNKGYKNI